MPGQGQGGRPQAGEAQQATQTGGQAQVEQEHRLLHLDSQQLGESEAQGRQEAGRQHQGVAKAVSGWSIFWEGIPKDNGRLGNQEYTEDHSQGRKDPEGTAAFLEDGGGETHDDNRGREEYSRGVPEGEAGK